MKGKLVGTMKCKFLQTWSRYNKASSTLSSLVGLPALACGCCEFCECCLLGKLCAYKIYVFQTKKYMHVYTNLGAPKLLWSWAVDWLCGTGGVLSVTTSIVCVSLSVCSTVVVSGILDSASIVSLSGSIVSSVKLEQQCKIYNISGSEKIMMKDLVVTNDCFQ